MRRTAMELDFVMVSLKPDQSKTLFLQVQTARMPGL
jgi:hypothetical protein